MSIAQRLEQGTHNPLVAGSNPAGRTKPVTRKGGGYFFSGQLRFRTAKGGFSFIDSPHQEQRS